LRNFEALNLLILAHPHKHLCEALRVNLGLQIYNQPQKVIEWLLIGFHILQKDENVIVYSFSNQLRFLRFCDLHQQSLMKFVGLLINEILSLL
jgi:hypothetical protein